MKNNIERMSSFELKAAASLASIYGLRMLGMFLILPVFAIYAEQSLGASHTQAGLALGIYGGTQALLQLPFGMASDRFGRKRMIYLGLLMLVVGSFIAAGAHDITQVIIGRALQGAGAISAVVMALLADLTREEHRTKAMAMIGTTIGVTFALSLVISSPLNHWIGVPGMFALTGILALIAMAWVRFVIPNPRISRFHSDAEATPAKLKDVLANTQLLRLNFGIFSLHAAQMALFVVIPFALLKTAGIPQNHHWMIYLPIMAGSFVLMVPAIIYGEKKNKLKQVFVASIALMLIAQLLLSQLIGQFWGIVVSLVCYFVAFNVLEASLPSLISKIAPASAKGTAMGVYNTSQSFGLFLGGVLGGYLLQHYGASAVFIFCSALIGLWLVLAFSMERPPAVRTRLFHVREMTEDKATELSRQLAKLNGVSEALVVGNEGIAILKVDMRGWDEAAVQKLIEGEQENGVSE
jgi:MFS family permease